MKPIEPGCLAILIKTEVEARIGMQVHVIRRAPNSGYVSYSDGRRLFLSEASGIWEVDADVPNPKCLPWFAHESQLLRIDGDESVETETREAETA